MKLISGANGSGFYAYSANSAAIATNDDLGRKISDTYLTGVDLSPYATTSQVDTVSSLLSAGLDYVSANAGGLDASAVILTGTNNELKHFDLTSGYWNHTSARPGYLAVSGVNTPQRPVDVEVTWTENGFRKVTHKLSEKLNATASAGFVSTATFTTISSTFSGAIDYVSANAGKTYSGVSPIVVNNDENKISANAVEITAGPGIRIQDYVISYTGSNADQVVQANSAYWNNAQTYTGLYPIVVNNTTNQISADTVALSAGNGIDPVLLETGVISVTGGSSFPITGTNGTTGFTANMDCSSVLLTTASSPAGGYVKQTVQGVQYEAYPATDVSASWNNIISAANNRSNCYCIRFTNDMTAADLANYSAYDKVTVVHSNEYTPDCHLYWDGNTKVFPSGLYCELVKGTNDQNQIDWFFTTSGWTNNLWWDWD